MNLTIEERLKKVEIIVKDLQEAFRESGIERDTIFSELKKLKGKNDNP